MRDDAFFGYVWTVAQNTYKSFLRRKKRGGSVDIDDISASVGDAVEEEIIRVDETRRLRREPAFLSHEYRLYTAAYYFDGFSCADII